MEQRGGNQLDVVRRATLFALLLTACAHRPDSRSCAGLGPIDSSWLVRRVSVKEAEQEHTVRGVPFGYQNDQWRALRAQMRRGDELWFYARKYPPLPADWKGPVVGAEQGYVLVRNCAIEAHIVTLAS